jgi:parallel beta-helix repeat protein
MRKISIFVILTFTVLLIFFSNSGISEENMQTTIYVGGSGTGNYSSIQEAINLANSNYTVFVYNGTYYGPIVINKSIKLVGQDKDNTFIDGIGENYVLKLEANYVNITNFTIQNSGKIFPNAGINIRTTGNIISGNNLINNYYGIVLLYPTSENIITDNYIANNNQCGIYFSGAKHNILTNNYVDTQPFNGFGLYDFSDYNTIKNNTLTHNQYCGVNIRDSYYNIVDGNNFIENTVGLHIPPPECKTTIGDNFFSGNQIMIEEERDLIIYSQITSIILIFIVFLYLRKKII